MQSNPLTRRHIAGLMLAYIARGGAITYCPARTYADSPRAKLAITRKPSAAQRRAIALRCINTIANH